MRTLTARTALEAWEKGQRVDPQGRALALLASVLPEVAPARLPKLTLGQRDALLMRLRERAFGHVTKGFVQCPGCRTRLEFPLDLRAYDVMGTLRRPLEPSTFSAEGYTIRFRVPDSEDLMEIAIAPEVEGARGLLLVRCILAAEHQGRPVSPWELPESVIEGLGKRMEELDPLAFLPLAIDCPRCAHAWTALFDIGTLLWQEISVSAERLLREVHALAFAYGWGEAEILAMSDVRRKFYLSQIPTSAAPGAQAPPGAPKGRPRA
jgi:hypothetical protein